MPDRVPHKITLILVAASCHCPLGFKRQGRNAIPWLEKLVVGDIAGLKPGTGTLSVLTNERGGIIDDTVVTKVADDEIYMVVNAGCRDKDLTHLGKHLEGASGVEMQVLDDRALLALQGPRAAEVLQVVRVAGLWVPCSCVVL